MLRSTVKFFLLLSFMKRSLPIAKRKKVCFVVGAISFEMSKIEAQKQATETMEKLLDSIASSVESSIRAQDQAIQFAMGMLDKINSSTRDTLSLRYIKDVLTSQSVNSTPPLSSSGESGCCAVQ
ncbi:MAG: hypothetical protein LBF34_02245 [Puniceicoccales bacterium]|jgi:hypothetical protein|nr:hypothetical protein [Puniceicoccales bacterium]